MMHVNDNYLQGMSNCIFIDHVCVINGHVYIINGSVFISYLQDSCTVSKKKYIVGHWCIIARQWYDLHVNDNYLQGTSNYIFIDHVCIINGHICIINGSIFISYL